MKSRLFAVLLITLMAVGCAGESEVLRTDTFRITLSSDGYVTRIQDWSNGDDYASRPSPLMQIRKGGEYFVPVSAFATSAGIELNYEDGTVAEIAVEEKSTHVTFELISLSEKDSVDLVLWGPFANSISESIGETVGIARGASFAIGLQSLNIRTLGGYPWNENDAMPQIDIFEDGEYYDMDAAKSRYVLYRVEAAKPDSMGSTLQAYTRNRLVDRIIPNQGYERYVAPAFNDGGVIGSKIALFGVPVEETLETIGLIELEENLPHPMIDDQWGKQARSANAAYIIMNFTEEQSERAIDLTKQAGLRYLYHDGPFSTWGRFELDETAFPDGLQSLRRIVDSAEEDGIMVGTHNLSNFVSTNDAYVTPRPDPRLAKVGSSVLTSAVSSTQPVVMIEDPGFFNQDRKSHLAAAQIGDEIITFSSISDSEPWQLRGVERGAFGTVAKDHPTGTRISKLDDHGYKVFLTETDLSIEMASTLARIYNETGLRQISFDGLEGNRSTGLGNYGESLFAQTWYDSLNTDIRSHYIADASRTTHFFWHMYTRMNWGEPWYADFRESQTEYRLKNQAYFERNLMPGMLGWFKMTEQTSVQDIEWMLSLSAGYDAGYGFVTSFNAIDGNGKTAEILALIGQWEKARMADVFTESQKSRLKARDQEFQLRKIDEELWALTPVSVHIFRRYNRPRQPGEPIESVFEFSSSAARQTVEMRLTADGSSLSQIVMELDNNPGVELDVTLQDGQSLVYTGEGRAVIYSSTWQQVGEIDVPAESFELDSGAHSLTFYAVQSGEEDHSARIEIRITHPAETVPAGS